jgi:hypothetical protein
MEDNVQGPDGYVSIEQMFRTRQILPHNINEHLETLRRLASACQSVVEFGVERGWSTSAFLASGCPDVRSYDVARWPDVDKILRLAPHWRFHLESSLECVIEPADLVFIDTVHTAEQCRGELARHANKAWRYLVFHDVVTFPDLNFAIEEFLRDRPEWHIKEHYFHQHGLLVLGRSAPWQEIIE